jgi:UDP-GlcNAc:undecaprenyl-phosphate GlcNAc-1-phosphate transferase
MLLYASFLLVGLFLFELFYFRLARKYSIVDVPNNRSSHKGEVIRGGGVLFFTAAITASLKIEDSYGFFYLGLFLISTISFIDDIKPQSSLIRIIVHLLSVLLLLYEVRVFDLPSWYIVPLIIITIGTINAFNFMDGINGMTGLYSLVLFSQLIYINEVVFEFIESEFLVSLCIASLVFLYFNYRKKAVCFAGDVGSVSFAFVSIFFVYKLIISTNNFIWILLFLVYGIDSVFTIIYRIYRKQNIFSPHRTHLYQQLVNEMQHSHRVVSFVYALLQLFFNAILVYTYLNSQYIYVVVFISLYIGLYLYCRHFYVKVPR